MTHFTRRTALAAALAATTALVAPGAAFAQDKPTLRLSSVVSENDIRAEAFAEIAEAVSDSFDMKVFNGSTLVAQGSEMTSIQRGNLEMGLIAPQAIAEQIPEWSIVTSAYLFSDADHLKATFDSDVGAQLKQMAADAGVHILAPVYFGTRQVNLAPEKEVMKPEDLNGVTLRMPGGEAWQFLGEAIGANPTPLAYAEVYTALQTGAIDGQDNPLPNDYNMKFYEVTSQIVLTGHLAKRRIQGRGKAVDVEKLAGNTDKPGVEEGHIAGELFHRVAGGIHRHHDHLGVFHFRAFKRLYKLVEERHGGGADIGTVGKTEEDQRPLVLEARRHKRLATVVNQREITHVTRCLQQKRAVCLHVGCRHHTWLVDAVHETGNDHQNKHQHPDDGPANTAALAGCLAVAHGG